MSCQMKEPFYQDMAGVLKNKILPGSGWNGAKEIIKWTVVMHGHMT